MVHKLSLLVLTMTTFVYAEDVINLSCIDNEGGKSISVVVDKENGKFSTRFDIFKLEESEHIYQGKDERYINQVIRYQLNRITLNLLYQELDWSLEAKKSGKRVIDEKKYSCSIVKKI
jgi:hypothetical protein